MSTLLYGHNYHTYRSVLLESMFGAADLNAAAFGAVD